MARSSAKPGARSPGRSLADQHRAFVEAARALGCDEDEPAFDEKLKAIARQQPKDEPKPSKAAHGKARQPNG